MVDVDFGSLEN